MNYIVYFFIFISGIIYSQEVSTIYTDRPNATDASQLLDPGDFQLEFGFFSDTDKNNNTTNRSITQPNISLKYGLLKWLEIRVLTNYQTAIGDVGGTNESKKSGITPITVSPKFKILESEGFINHLALSTSFTLPKTGHTAFQNNNLNFGYRFLLGTTLLEKVSWSHSFGTDWDDNSDDTWIYSSSFGFTITEKFGAFTELYGTSGNSNAYYWDGGLTYLFLNNLTGDAMLGLGLNDNASNYYVSFGLAWKTNFKK